jgi:glycosyltransferase involved in cell wall biosynthesis
MSTDRFVFAIPGDIQTQTGGYIYDRRLIGELRAQGREMEHLELGASFPNPTEADTQDAADKLARIPSTSPVIIDGLALGALDKAAVAAMSAPLVALVHHPLALEGGLEASRREYLFQTERDNLRQAQHVIVTSPHTAELLSRDYGVPEARITIAQPGTDQPVRGTKTLDVPLIVSVGIQVPRKGHDVLLRALAEIVNIPWQAVIAGSVLDATYGATLETLRDQLGLTNRVRFAGHVSEDELAELYRQASVFALATRFEGYGMVFNEAMAHGLPIVSCRTGAVPDTVAPDGSVLVPPDDPKQFATALSSVLEDTAVRHTMAEASAEAGRMLITWEQTAAAVGAVLDGLQGSSGHNKTP